MCVLRYTRRDCKWIATVKWYNNSEFNKHAKQNIPKRTLALKVKPIHRFVFAQHVRRDRGRTVTQFRIDVALAPPPLILTVQNGYL